MAAINDRQSATAQQQIAEQFKQSANERQHQVEAAMHGSHGGKISTEDLNQEHRQGKSGQEEPDEKCDKENSADAAVNLHHPAPPDQIRGRMIDIKT